MFFVFQIAGKIPTDKQVGKLSRQLYRRSTYDKLSLQNNENLGISNASLH